MDSSESIILLSRLQIFFFIKLFVVFVVILLILNKTGGLIENKDVILLIENKLELYY
jgi:hypothetical protein